ncbi:hypothetical protein BDQ17DRAFT_1428031 [Cyathus striatus]|nr:hypothetical protein BDQ17DRAFT_1428031 [Cyathus striatus]
MPINQELRDFLAQFIPECDLKVLDSYGRNEMSTEQPPSPPSDSTLDSELSETDFRPPTEQLSPSDPDSSSESEFSDTDFRLELDAIFNFDDPAVSTRHANSLKEEMGDIDEAASVFNAINCDSSMPASIEFPKKLLEKATSAAAEIVIDYIGDAIFCENTQILLQLMKFAPDDHASYQMAKFIRAAHSKNILRSASNFWLYGLVTPRVFSYSVRYIIYKL